MGIRVDALPATALPNRAHVVPAMREGLTVRLTVAQILGLALGTDVTVDPSGFVNLNATKVQAMMAQIDALFTAYLSKSGNLAGLANADTALGNLGGGTYGRDIFKNASTLGATLAKIADAAAGRSALGAPAIPITSAGVGQVLALNPASDNGTVLPAGGIWFYAGVTYSNSGTNFAQGFIATTASGGATVRAAAVGQTHTGFAWRIA